MVLNLLNVERHALNLLKLTRVSCRPIVVQLYCARIDVLEMLVKNGDSDFIDLRWALETILLISISR